MLAVHSVVSALIFEPDTPGGFRCSIDCNTESSSATADAIVRQALCYGTTDDL